MSAKYFNYVVHLFTVKDIIVKDIYLYIFILIGSF